MRLLIFFIALLAVTVVSTEAVAVSRCSRLSQRPVRRILASHPFVGLMCPEQTVLKALEIQCVKRCEHASAKRCRQLLRRRARPLLDRLGCCDMAEMTMPAETTTQAEVISPVETTSPPVTTEVTSPVETTSPPVTISTQPTECILVVEYNAFPGHGPWIIGLAEQTQLVEVTEVGVGSFNYTVSLGDELDFFVRDIQFAESFPNDQFQGKYDLRLNGVSISSGNVDAAEFVKLTVADDACTVLPAEERPFKIEFIFDRDTIDPSYDWIFQTAAARWESIIRKSSGSKTFELLGERTVAQDLIIEASIESLGNPTIIATGGPTGFKSELDGWRPFFGFVVVSQTSIDLMDAMEINTNDTLLEVISHEVGHAIGVGDLWDNFRDDLRNPGEDNLEYIGVNGVMQLESYSLQDEPFVPLSDSTGENTFLVHWREAVLENELMTGLIDPGKLPLSRISIGFLEDIGYEVNYSRADPYSLPSSAEAVREDFEELVDDGFRLLGSALVKPRKKAFLLDPVRAPSTMEDFEAILDDAMKSGSEFESRKKTKKVPRG